MFHSCAPQAHCKPGACRHWEALGYNTDCPPEAEVSKGTKKGSREKARRAKPWRRAEGWGKENRETGATQLPMVSASRGHQAWSWRRDGVEKSGRVSVGRCKFGRERKAEPVWR